MAYPSIYNPVAVTIRQYNIAATIMDADFREPVANHVSYTDLQTFAQIVYKKEGELQPAFSGDLSLCEGYLVFTRTVFDALTHTPIKKGDKIILVEDQTVDYDVSEVRRTGTLRGRSWLVLVYFMQPSERNAPRI